MKTSIELTPEQKLRQARRLHLEEMEWTTVRYLSDLRKECTEHVVIKGRLMWSPAKGKVVNTMEGRENETCCGASCAICGVNFEWWCPVNPKGYCEYDESDPYGCKFCHEPDERK